MGAFKLKTIAVLGLLLLLGAGCSSDSLGGAYNPIDTTQLPDAGLSSTDPTLDFYDTDATDGDVNASIVVGCTDTGSGTEDCDVTFSQQVAGSSTAFLSSDADGNMSLRNGAVVMDQSNEVGIGTATPAARLDVLGATQTGSGAIGAVNVAQTWNTTGDPTLILADVTNTASGAASRLIDLQVGGSSRFAVSKNGEIIVNVPGTYSPFIFSSLGTQLFAIGFPGSNGVDLNNTSIGGYIRMYGAKAGNDSIIMRTGTTIGSVTDLSYLYNALTVNGSTQISNGSTGAMKINQIWNTTGAPSALLMDITDTASDAASKLMDLQVGSSSMLNISKTGSVFVAEKAAADADVAAYGQFWVKSGSPNVPMFTDDAGNDYELATTTQVDYAEAYDADNTDAFVVNSTDEWHAYHTNGLASSNLGADWTFDAGGAGTSFPIASIADAGGGDITVTTTGAHGLAVGDIVSQTNLTDPAYVGFFEVLTVPTTTTYTVTATYTATDTGTMDQAATFVAGSGAAGLYEVHWYASATSATSNETFDFKLYNGASAVASSETRRKFSTSGDFGSFSGGSLVNVAAGDKISFSMKNTSSGGDVTIRYLTMFLTRL